MDNPFFTVVIPTYNRSVLLKRAIESVLSQTFESFELIVIDDHSTDDTISVVKSYFDTRIRYMTNNRTKGACGARNTGIYSAKGKWVAFLDDDDVWLPKKLKYQYELMRGGKENIGLVCTDYAIYKENKTRPVIVKNRPIGWIRDKLLYGGQLGCLSSVSVRTEVLKAIDGFDEGFPSNQDWDLYLRVAELCEVTHVPKTLVNIYMEYSRDRIGISAKNKLEGWIMLRNKYSTFICKSLRLRHSFESNILIYAFMQKEKDITLKCLPWFLFGLLVDFPSFLRTVRTIGLLVYRKNVETRIAQK